jgi:HD superfamily phosphohydrolase YqeK
MKQTAVEWLEKQIKDIFYVAEASEMTKKFKSVYEQAKQMEKEQIIKAHGIKESHGAEGSRNIWQQTTGEQYYKEQYEREDNKH